MGVCIKTKESLLKVSKFKDPNKANIDPNLKKGVCKIETPKLFGSGFFMKYKINEKYYYYLVSCEHVITTDLIQKKETIKILYDNDINNIELRMLDIKLDKNERYIKAFKDIMDLDITIIEIKSEDNIPENYFLFSELNKIYNENLINRRIYILQYPNGQKLQVSNGYIKRINKNEFFHFASTQNGSSGSPVFLLNETKVIGIHKQSNRSENIGDFIYQIFDVLKNDVDKIKGNYNINNSKKSNNEKDYDNGCSRHAGYGKCKRSAGSRFIHHSAPHRRISRYEDQRRHCPQGSIWSQARQYTKRWKYGRC